MSEQEIARLAALEDPVRRRLFDYVRERSEPIGREEAAEAVGIGRSLAAYHLDKLAEERLLETHFARPEGKGGPGAGRPAKLYAPAEGEVSVSVPERDYELAARLLARAAEADPAAARALAEVAHRTGRELGSSGADTTELTGALRERGYEPFADEDGVIRLRNCPFHRLAADHRDLVCGMNLEFLNGLLEGLEATGVRGSLEPEPGRCCVAIRPAVS
jgi:predicted ArsR family transcriptional regulator